MKPEKSLMLVLCALLAIVCGCGTGEPDASQGAAEVVAEPDVAQEPADGTTEPDTNQDTTEALAVELEEFTNSLGMKFKLIPAGEFMMGSPEDEEGRRDDETQHSVRITKPYYLGVTEVTQGQWEAVMGTRPWEGEEFAKSNPAHAVSYVTWEEAVEFCGKLLEKEGLMYSLPTEAEWEYACRAGSTTRYCFGDDDSDFGSYGWYGENAFDVDEKYAHGVGLKRANTWGLYDMHGNVCEWCSDRYARAYYENSPTDNPTGPLSGWNRVIHGGSWFNSPRGGRSAERTGYMPDFCNVDLGFRVALDPAE